MKNKILWDKLTHEERLHIFQSHSIDQIINSFLPKGVDKDEFKRAVEAEIAFWRPQNIREIKEVDKAPTKDTTIGAWRDLNRAEALLELLDNSIDAWMKRRPKPFKKLQIYIKVDSASKTLEYEDNAGGVSEANLINLVIPGYSETVDEEPTIGSYRTGGKKAIFKLASDANIRTRYLSPFKKTDEAFEIHLDEAWLNDPTLYRFPRIKLKNKDAIGRGHTIYQFRLREGDTHGAVPWYEDIDVVDEMTREIRRAYTLLLARHPEIEIHFLDERPLSPLEDLYVFSGTNEKGTDLRPQRINVLLKLPWKGKNQNVVIELVLGCRTNVAAKKGEDASGIDLYGNDRLFIHHDQDYFIRWFGLTTGQARHLIRGFVNVHGPNVFIPWDTHKRHLNPEREIIQVLQKQKAIKEFFELWNKTYKDVAKLGKEVFSQSIKEPLKPWKHPSRNDVNIPFTNSVSIPVGDFKISLPGKMHKPKVALKSASKSKPIQITITLTKAEFKKLSIKFGIQGSSEDRSSREELANYVKESAFRIRPEDIAG